MDKNMKQLKQSLLIISFIWAFACSEDKHGPLSDKGNTPASVNNVSVENLSGAARISYSLPVDVDILYVKAINEVDLFNNWDVFYINTSQY